MKKKPNFEICMLSAETSLYGMSKFKN